MSNTVAAAGEAMPATPHFKISLSTGSHAAMSDGACVMELVSHLAGYPWGIWPRNVCPVIAMFATGLNDLGPQWVRDELSSRAFAMIGSRWQSEERRVVIFGAAAIHAAEAVLLLFEQRIPNDPSPRRAIQAAKDALAGGDAYVAECAGRRSAYAAVMACRRGFGSVRLAALAATKAAMAAVDQCPSSAAQAAQYAADVDGAPAESIWRRHLQAFDDALAIDHLPERRAA